MFEAISYKESAVGNRTNEEFNIVENMRNRGCCCCMCCCSHMTYLHTRFSIWFSFPGMVNTWRAGTFVYLPVFCIGIYLRIPTQKQSNKNWRMYIYGLYIYAKSHSYVYTGGHSNIKDCADRYYWGYPAWITL